MEHNWCNILKWGNFEKKKIAPLKKLNIEVNYFNENYLSQKPENFIDTYTGPYHKIDSGDWDNFDGN